jgi:hypothetical protein
MSPSSKLGINPGKFIIEVVLTDEFEASSRYYFDINVLPSNAYFGKVNAKTKIIDAIFVIKMLTRDQRCVLKILSSESKCARLIAENITINTFAIRIASKKGQVVPYEIIQIDKSSGTIELELKYTNTKYISNGEVSIISLNPSV